MPAPLTCHRRVTRRPFLLLMLAALLACLQWSASLHMLGHLGDADGPEGAATCVQCLAHAGHVFTIGGAPVIVPPRLRDRPRFPTPAERPSHTLPTPFGARAPPVLPVHA